MTRGESALQLDAPLKAELDALVKDAMLQYLAREDVGSRAPESSEEVQEVLRAACVARLSEMESLGADARMPEVTDALARFIESLDARGPALHVAPCAVHVPTTSPWRHIGVALEVRSPTGTPRRRVGGGWVVPRLRQEAPRPQEDLRAVERCAERLSLFVKKPAEYLDIERQKRAKARKSLSMLADGVEAKMRLQKITKCRPYIEHRRHPLNHWLHRSRDCLAAGEIAEAYDHLERMETALQLDEQRLKAAYEKFDHDGSGDMGVSEFRHFAVYVGFGAEAVDDALRASDRDADGSISLAEFSDFVGRMGGVHALFEQRRRKLKATGDLHTFEVGSRVRAHFQTKHGMSQSVWDGRVLALSNDRRKANVKFDMGKVTFSQEIPREWIEQDIDVIEAMQEVGILDDAQHYWTMILPLSEQLVVKTLVSCQRTAIDHVRTMATHNHSKAMPELIARTQSIGISEEQLWAMLSWIRDSASIIIHVRLDCVGKFLEKDTHYRNQFETGTSCGLLNSHTRMEWERDLFGGAYDSAAPSLRPKYGVMDVMNDPRGVVSAHHYGDSYLVLKDVRLRCSFAPEDSGGICGSRLAVLDQYAHVLLEYGDNELLEVARVANAPEGSEERIGDSMHLEDYNYKEAQIHGDINLKEHVRRLVVDERHHTADAEYGEARVRALCRKHGWECVFMNDERTRRIREERGSTNPNGCKVNWNTGEVVAYSELPDALPGAATHQGMQSGARERTHDPGFWDYLTPRSCSIADNKRPVSDLSDRALKRGLGALTEAERARLHTQWAGHHG